MSFKTRLFQCCWAGFRDTDQRVLQFQGVDRFLDGADHLLSESLPNAAGVVATFPGETAGGVAKAAEEVGQAFGNVLNGMGGGTAEVIRPPVKLAEAAVVTAVTPVYEVAHGVKEIVWDTPSNLVNEGPWSAVKSLAHGALWRPVRAVARTAGNAAKGLINTTVGVFQSGFRGLGKLVGIGLTEEGAAPTGKGLLGAISNLTQGVRSLFKGVGDSKLAKKAGEVLGGDPRWEWGMSITGEGNTAFPGIPGLSNAPSAAPEEEAA